MRLAFISMNIRTQNNRHWSAENPHFIHIHLHDVEVGVSCALSVRRIIGPVVYPETINSDRYVRQILQLFFRQLTYEESFLDISNKIL
jgi:hypothetical protein